MPLSLGHYYNWDKGNEVVLLTKVILEDVKKEARKRYIIYYQPFVCIRLVCLQRLSRVRC